MQTPSLSAEDKSRYGTLNRENLDFLMNRYNRVNRWVIADMIRRSCYHYPDKTAVVFGEKSMTYRELEEASNRVANGLADLGVKKYDRVAILAHNTIHHVLTWLGCCKIGAIYLAVNYLLKGKDIAYCIDHSESRVFVVEDALHHLVSDVLDGMKTVRNLIWSDDMAGQAPPDDRFMNFETWYKACPAEEPRVILRIEDPCQMTYTSGTESLPKGVIISNQALMAEYMGAIIDGRYGADDINVNALPIYHCAQRDVFMNPIFWVGGTNVLMAPDIGDILKTIASHKATMFFAPPTVWIGMMRHPDFDTYDLSSLKKCYYGASIMPVEILKEMLKRLPGAGICNYYGQTELAPYHTILKAEDALSKLGSAGMGGLNMETRLEDDLGNAVEVPGVPGEICGRGPHAMIMYFKDPEKTEDVMRGGWFHSGDIGILDEDRYVAVVDRKKDMIKTGGENVSTREVEEIIYQDQRVEEVAVIGVDHAKWVEAVTAVVVPRKGKTITEEEIIQRCREHLAPFKVPKKIVFMEALPKTPTGKILKREMRKTYKDMFLEE
ncbi:MULTISPECIES: acyl-CoA synthetase [Desulfococcus]|uniref:AMP-dependent synthetase and ligase n=1 Tax=Desulfococcus multivorans DSM 2059 TaxID=1121405 RepID=S7TSA2_DESML|nr:acyl-CoA synthetase [Desulfococcus multivorans]AOY57133.1 AMP-dependent synthetase and ligase [Desulfococcus multivorans]AQU99630.1 acyl-CoA synthetase [Desulfococcus multivorans]EPR39891.1 AMP-dependent synthetase and ligase [Desulfococcus multivorans DSM 2059]SKA22834.1 fatty-acyl-CoA synthase [Desulfococcus multivorans DSM 2059]